MDYSLFIIGIILDVCLGIFGLYNIGLVSYYREEASLHEVFTMVMSMLSFGILLAILLEV